MAAANGILSCRTPEGTDRKGRNKHVAVQGTSACTIEQRCPAMGADIVPDSSADHY